MTASATLYLMFKLFINTFQLINVYYTSLILVIVRKSILLFFLFFLGLLSYLSPLEVVILIIFCLKTAFKFSVLLYFIVSIQSYKKAGIRHWFWIGEKKQKLETFILWWYCQVQFFFRHSSDSQSQFNCGQDLLYYLKIFKEIKSQYKIKIKSFYNPIRFCLNYILILLYKILIETYKILLVFVWKTCHDFEIIDRIWRKIKFLEY